MASPLKQFEIIPIVPLQLQSLGIDISFTNSSLFMVLGAVISAAFLSFAMRPQALIPGRTQALAEIWYEIVASVMRENTGPKYKPYLPFVFTLFSTVMMGNMLGMLPYSFTFTSHLAATFTLALVVIIGVTLIGFYRHGLHFFSLFAPEGAPMWLMPLVVPIEMISYLARPVSLSVRLFANMLAGHTMLKIFAGFSVALGVFGGLAPLVVNVVLIGFEVMVSFLQAYVFALLTCVYLRDAIELH